MLPFGNLIPETSFKGKGWVMPHDLQDMISGSNLNDGGHVTARRNGQLSSSNPRRSYSWPGSHASS